MVTVTARILLTVLFNNQFYIKSKHLYIYFCSFFLKVKIQSIYISIVIKVDVPWLSIKIKYFRYSITTILITLDTISSISTLAFSYIKSNFLHTSPQSDLLKLNKFPPKKKTTRLYFRFTIFHRALPLYLSLHS